jgi:hypothetical protein
MLAELIGSPKQIAWAKSIRKDKLVQWKSSDPIVFQRVEPNLHNETSAKWWIDQRESDIGAILASVQGSATGKVMGKPAVSKVPEPSTDKKTYVVTGDDSGITRYVGELRDAVTGEIVVDPDCPF